MWIAYGMMFVLGLLSAFLIFIVLLQRGRGGGLAGALGGMGGQSAFGTKAGDVFTKITVILAMVWIVLAAGSIPLMRYLAGGKFVPGEATPPTITASPLKGDAATTLPDDSPAGDAEQKPQTTTPSSKDDEGEKPSDDEKTDGKKSDDGTTDGEKPETPSTDEPKPDAKSETEPKSDTEKPAEDAKNESEAKPKE